MRTIHALREDFESNRVETGPASLPRIIALAFILSDPESKDKSADQLVASLVKELYALARNPNLLIRMLWQMKQRPAKTASMTALAQAIREYK